MGDWGKGEGGEGVRGHPCARGVLGPSLLGVCFPSPSLPVSHECLWISGDNL